MGRLQMHARMQIKRGCKAGRRTFGQQYCIARQYAAAAAHSPSDSPKRAPDFK
jgi:hypothetical protein